MQFGRILSSISLVTFFVLSIGAVREYKIFDSLLSEPSCCLLIDQLVIENVESFEDESDSETEILDERKYLNHPTLNVRSPFISFSFNSSDFNSIWKPPLAS